MPTRQKPYFPRLNFFVLTLIGILWGVFGNTVEVDYGIFTILIVLTGIPHGATDHILHQATQQETNWWEFLGIYLGTMLVYGLAWYFFPLVSLLIFLGISAYHFGQSQLLYLNISEKSPSKTFTYLLWGTWLLTSLLLLRSDESAAILEGLFPQVSAWIRMGAENVVLIVGVLSGLVLFNLLIHFVNKRIKIDQIIEEFTVILALLLLFNLSSLWVSFGIYFGVWHACSSIRIEIDGLKQQRAYSLAAFFREALPFSLVSFAGIALLIVAGVYLKTYVSLPLLFFIAISTLTLPHLLYIQRFYVLLEQD